MALSLALYGALKTPNFGDVLLAQNFFNLFTERGASVSFPSLGAAVADELQVIPSGPGGFAKADAVVFIGGGYLSPPPGSIFKWGLSRYISIFSKAHICRIMGKPYSILGVGAGPVASPLTTVLFRSFCNGATELIVRDFESAAYLKSIGVRREIKVGADCALSIKVPTRAQNKRQIGIHLSSQLPHVNDAVVAYLNKKNLIGEAFLIEDHTGELDRIRSRQPNILQAFEGRIISYKGYEDFITTLASFTFVLTSKLHVGIVCSRLGLKVCALPYHSKVPNFYRDVGRSDLCLFEPIGAGAIEEHIEYCLSAENVLIPKEVMARLSIIESAVTRLASK